MKLNHSLFQILAGVIAGSALNVYSLTVSVAPNGNIQGAINQVAAAGGGTVNITSGTATISTALTIPGNVTINGAGNPSTTLNLSSSITSAGFQATSSTWSGITVQNIKIQGAGASVNQNGVDLSTGSGSNGKMSNVQALNTGYDGGKLAYSNGSVTSCNFHNCGNSAYYHCFYLLGGSYSVLSGNNMNYSLNGSGLHVNNWMAVNGSQSVNNITSNNGQNGHSFTANTSNAYNNITINGCTANSNGGGPGTAGASGYGFYLGSGSGIIENCTATGNLTQNYLFGSFSSSNNH
ncbi:MAG TPA: hypothetical protein VF988_03585 [Verrucomicrobiae bacterium]